MTPPPVVATLRPGREKPARHGHPWIFSGAVADWSAEPAVGSVADVRDGEGRWIARGLVHPGADLAIRLYTWDEAEALDEAFWRRRVDEAVDLRATLFPEAGPRHAARLVFSEADRLSGLIVDQYADTLSIRLGSAALRPALPILLDQLRLRTGAAAASVAAERDQIRREGLVEKEIASLSFGNPGPVEIEDAGCRFLVDPGAGQKTGFYLDQRVNRHRVAAYAPGRRVLSAYCYTGAFEVHAARAGATSITGIDSSADAVAAAKRHLELNAEKVPADYIVGDVPVVLRSFRDARRNFDLIILDPPRFVVKAEQIDKGLRAYKDINLLAMKLLSPGGILATFSCSGLVKAADFRLALAWAAADAGRMVRIVDSLAQAPDHPILPAFPESDYLCGFIAHVS
jgi:23S rRNA (cytosine1962-C5)-methyltransferase